MIKRILTFGIIILILLGIGYWVYLEVAKMRNKDSSQPQMPPTAVTVAKAKQEQWYNQVKATGTMSAFQGVMVEAEVSGRVTNIYFDEGTEVKQGDPLVQIYPDILEAQLQRNEAALKLAMLDYERGVELYKKRAISRQDLDTLTSSLQQNEANVAQTQAQLAQHNITAPFSGLLGLNLIDLGSQVAPGQSIVQLQQVDPIRVQFTVPEVYLDELSMGQDVTIKPGYGNKTYTGSVYALDSGVNPNNRSLGIRARIPNQGRELIPGTFAEVTLFAGKKHTVITVPQTSITYSSQGIYVYQVEDNKAVRTTVTIGLRKGDEVEVTSGLDVGDVVVTAGQIKLTNNAPVVIKQPGSTDASPKTADLNAALTS